MRITYFSGQYRVPGWELHENDANGGMLSNLIAQQKPALCTTLVRESWV
jgi:hypothetical protein